MLNLIYKVLSLHESLVPLARLPPTQLAVFCSPCLTIFKRISSTAESAAKRLVAPRRNKGNSLPQHQVHESLRLTFHDAIGFSHSQGAVFRSMDLPSTSYTSQGLFGEHDRRTMLTTSTVEEELTAPSSRSILLYAHLIPVSKVADIS
jgi:hypothetical protein